MNNRGFRSLHVLPLDRICSSRHAARLPHTPAESRAPLVPSTAGPAKVVYLGPLPCLVALEEADGLALVGGCVPFRRLTELNGCAPRPSGWREPGCDLRRVVSCVVLRNALYGVGMIQTWLYFQWWDDEWDVRCAVAVVLWIPACQGSASDAALLASSRPSKLSFSVPQASTALCFVSETFKPTFCGTSQTTTARNFVTVSLCREDSLQLLANVRKFLSCRPRYSVNTRARHRTRSCTGVRARNYGTGPVPYTFFCPRNTSAHLTPNKCITRPFAVRAYGFTDPYRTRLSSHPLRDGPSSFERFDGRKCVFDGVRTEWSVLFSLGTWAHAYRPATAIHYYIPATATRDGEMVSDSRPTVA
uniref:Uncharacterized protein n=1 Tax=Mycena chlorophos TaxID=658473 RepID=A0ABQ0LHU6_MYCCL|nr:predicted protein [Mycena chlorophos]